MDGPFDKAREDAGVSFWIQIVAGLYCQWTKKVYSCIYKKMFSVFGILMSGRGAIFWLHCHCVLSTAIQTPVNYCSFCGAKANHNNRVLNNEAAMIE